MKILINSGLVTPVFSKRDKLINQIKSYGHEVTVSGYEIEGEKACKKNHVGFAYIKMSRSGMNPIADIKTLFRYYKYIKKEKFDIVHSYTSKPNIYASIAAKMAGVKGIYPTINGLGYAFTGNTLKNKIVRLLSCVLYKIAFACSTKVFFQNADDAQEMVKRHVIKKDKCVVIAGSGIDLDKYPYSKVKNHNTFFLASRLLITKGLREYFKAAEIVKKQYPNSRFLLAGAIDESNPDGIKQEELDRYTSNGVIEYLGKINNMEEVLSECGIFVLPSYYREGVPHAILEAMSIGRAIITTDSPGCRETVNGKNGFLVPPKDEKELAEKMKKLIRTPEMVIQMGKESRKFAEEKFDVKKVNNKMCETMNIKKVVRK